MHIPRLTLARRRALHPGYVRSTTAKPRLPAEVYAYPSLVRRDAGWRAPKMPPAPQSPEPTPSLSWLPAAYGIVLMALWAVAANVTPGV